MRCCVRFPVLNCTQVEVPLQGGVAGHAKYKCPVCGQQAPSLKNMKEHFEAKHPKQTFEEEKCINTHEQFGGTTSGVAVRGSAKK